MRSLSIALTSLSFVFSSISLANTPSLPSVREELLAHQGTSFERLIKKWEANSEREELSNQLITLSKDSSLGDASRYIALQGAARLIGKPGKPVQMNQFEGLARDPSWMIRSGALKALEVTDTERASRVAAVLLGDPAFVVRLEAMSSLEKLRPTGSQIELSLLNAAEDPRNWRNSQPLQIPTRAIHLLALLRKRPLSGSQNLKQEIASLRAEMAPSH